MTRDEYLRTLRLALSHLSSEEREDICRDFEEHFAIGISQGKTEHEISAELGSPAAIADSYNNNEGSRDSFAGHRYPQSSSPQTAAAPATSAKQRSGRLFVILFNCLFAGWAIFSLISTVIGFWMSVPLLISGGILSFVSIGSADLSSHLLLLMGFAGICLGIGLCLLMIVATKALIRGIRLYINWCKKVYREGF